MKVTTTDDQKPIIKKKLREAGIAHEFEGLVDIVGLDIDFSGNTPALIYDDAVIGITKQLQKGIAGKLPETIKVDLFDVPEVDIQRLKQTKNFGATLRIRGACVVSTDNSVRIKQADTSPRMVEVMTKKDLPAAKNQMSTTHLSNGYAETH